LDVALDNVGDGRVANVANGKGHVATVCVPEVVSQAKDRPVVIYSSEILVLSIGQLSVVNKLGTNGCVSPRLVGCTVLNRFRSDTNRLEIAPQTCAKAA
jgi:hypothetical protein